MIKFEELIKGHTQLCVEATERAKKMQRITKNFVRYPSYKTALSYIQEYYKIDGMCDLMLYVDVELFGRLLKTLDEDLLFKAFEYMR